MDKPPMVARKSRRERRAQMAELLALREREGLSWKELGRRAGMPPTTLQYWKRRVSPAAAPAGFVELTVGEAPSSSRFEVVLRSGHRVLVPADFPEGALRRLVAALEPGC